MKNSLLIFIFFILIKTSNSYSQSSKVLQDLKDSTKWAYELNPTGSPIGGGKYYKKVILKSNAKYVVSTKDSLLYYLSIAKPGDVVYVDDRARINLTGTKNIKINKGVTLASGRGDGSSEGAIITSKDFWPESNGDALFITGGDSARITGLRLEGPSPDVLDHDYDRRGVANAIRCFHQNLEIDNNEIYAWDKWAIWLYYSKNAYVHHNYIHHNILNGYGYGVWCGGKGGESNSYALIEANIFEAMRHCIASSGHLNEWEARYNVILRKQLYVNFDRHDQGSKLYGGKSITLRNNIVFSTQKHYGFAIPADTVNGFIKIENNYFRRDSVDAGTYSDAGYTKETINRIVSIKNNSYNFKGVKLPIAIIKTTIDSGKAPLKVIFDGSESYDSTGVSIIRYVWRFGSGTFRGNESRTMKPVFTFKYPGIYNVTLVAYNSFGIPSNVTQKKIVVLPSDSIGKYVLSAWVKDTYTGSLKGIYEKQILVDDSVVWRDDVAGNEGWQHVIVDITKKGGPGSVHRIATRLVSIKGVSDYLTQICELYYWTDDFTVFNTNAWNVGFENDKMYPPWNQKFNIKPGGPNISTALTTEESRSGERSCRIRFAYGGNTPPGNWGEFYQYVTFK